MGGREGDDAGSERLVASCGGGSVGRKRTRKGRRPLNRARNGVVSSQGEGENDDYYHENGT